MQVTDRHGERVGGIVRRGRLRQAQEQLDHLLHLVLVRAPVSDHRSLDFSGRVLDHLATSFDGGKHGDTTRVAKLECASRVARIEDVLDNDVLRLAFRESRG